MPKKIKKTGGKDETRGNGKGTKQDSKRKETRGKEKDPGKEKAK
jgi:hypothetical protein